MAYLVGVDVSWPQGNYVPAPGHQFVGVGAVSADGGKPFVQSTYHQQVSNAHAAGKPVLHYAFNGRYDPAALADYLMNNLFDFRAGDGIALDVESSEKGTYPAYNPAQGMAFTIRIAARRGISTQAARVAIYGPIAEMAKAGWGALEKAGCWLWLAWPGAESKIRLGEWSTWTMWQYTISGGVDQDYTKIPLQQIVGSAPSRSDEDEPMYFLATSASDDKVIVAGWSYEKVGGGPLYPMTNLESFFAAANGATFMSIAGADIALIGAISGVADHLPLPAGNVWGSAKTPLLGPGKFTGKFIFNGTNSNQPMDYPYAGGDSAAPAPTAGLTADDLAKVEAAASSGATAGVVAAPHPELTVSLTGTAK